MAAAHRPLDGAADSSTGPGSGPGSASGPGSGSGSGSGSDPDPRTASLGAIQGVGAYLWWGVVTVLYFRWLREVTAWELLAWRVLGGFPVLVVLLAVRGDLGAIRRALADPPTRRRLALSTVLISANWFCFILAVVTERVTEASLGYYINPLVSVALGMVFLGEKLRPLQALAVVVAAAGVIVLTVAQGSLPWISLVLATSFGVYGLLRKGMAAGPAAGLAVEMLVLLPVMAVLEVWILLEHGGLFARDAEVTFGLLVGGVVTVVPLVLFASAARRLRLATVGLLQYLAPSAQLAIAVLAFGEPFGPQRVLAFTLIWIAVALYTASAWKAMRAGRIAHRPLAPPGATETDASTTER